MSAFSRSITEVPLFRGLPKEAIRFIEQHIVVKRYPKNETICKVGDHSTLLGLLLSGSLSVSVLTPNGREVGLTIIHSPTSFGELSAIDSKARSASLTTNGECIVGWLTQAALNTAITNTPQLALNLLQHMAGLVRATNEQVLLLSNHSTLQRICTFLLRKPFLVSGGDIQVIDLPPQREIANLTNTTRETVSRTLVNLEEDGVVKKQGKKLIIVDRDALERIINDCNS